MSKVCVYFESYLVGGLDTFAVQLINNWDLDDEITLLCNASHSGLQLFKSRISNSKCHVEINNMLMPKDISGKLSNHYLSKIVYVLLYWVLVPYYILRSYKVLKLDRFDYLHVINGGYPACLSSRCVAISWWKYRHQKSIHNFHNIAYRSHICFKLVDEYIDKKLIQATSHFIGVSKCCSESLRVRRAFVNIDNISYIYNGIDENIIKPQFNIREEYNISNSATILMMLATYEERKGHKFILNMISELEKKEPNIHLFFLGYGSASMIKKVTDYADSLRLNKKVTCLGFKPNVMEYLAQTDFLLIGSQEFESFGLTAIEAMKYRKIVFSTNVGGLKEVLADGEGGYLFEPNDCIGMADKILSVMTDNNRNFLEEAGYQRYKNLFTVSNMTRNYRRLVLLN